jgi:hypothetical protein
VARKRPGACGRANRPAHDMGHALRFLRGLRAHDEYRNLAVEQNNNVHEFVTKSYARSSGNLIDKSSTPPDICSAAVVFVGTLRPGWAGLFAKWESVFAGPERPGPRVRKA